MNRAVTEAVERALGERVRSSRPVSGGDINDAFQVTLASGEALFVKTNADAPAGLFAAEAEGLRWLAAADALRVPQVRALGDEPAFLALEWLESASAAKDAEVVLGRGLAALHRVGAPGFGFHQDNFIGTLPQQNRACASWSEFYAACRLQPLVRRGRDAGTLPDALARDLDSIARRLDDWVGPPEPPARLHGDLWGGNLLRDESGHACLVDPAVYGGHREVDLAMLRLFGGPSERAFDAYAEAFPLAPGAPERVALYQLYPLLVHVNLFGRGYVGSLAAAASRYA